jgi:hypothetical protein
MCIENRDLLKTKLLYERDDSAPKRASIGLSPSVYKHFAPDGA